LANRRADKLPLSCGVPLPHADLTAKIIGVFFKVFNELGHGYAEKLYQRALAIALRESGLVAIEEQQIKVFFHGALIGTFSADLVVEGTILIEVKAAKQFERRYEAQILNYLKSAGGGVGLLANFGDVLTHKRFVMGNPEANLPNLVPRATRDDERY
jgi:GxxExxY protein